VAKGKSEFQISWTTISYRSVLLAVLVVMLLVGTVFYFLFPKPAQSALDKAGSYISALLQRVAGSSATPGTVSAGQQQANFTALDGTVRVRKRNSNEWVAAQYNVPLEKGDVVQTGAEGIAKILFADGTSYTIKQDSLIVIEENSTNAARQTNVSVQVTTGTVDLATATYAQGSQSQVVVAGATARLAPESAAQVRNDPRNDQHEILVKAGSGEVVRGNETVSLASYEKVSFSSDSAKMAKSKEIAPPTLIAPANMMPMFVGGAAGPVEFSWTPIEGAKGYHLRVSKNPYFSSTVYDRRVQTSSVKLPALGEGAYYWVVQTVDASGKISAESEKNRFTVIKRGATEVQLALELDPFIQHGHVIEVRGKTEPSARVMVNGQEVPVITSEGQFHYFTPPLPTGENVITITAQNTKGGVSTMTKKVVIQ
jgi:hypothetical protein